MKLRNLIGSVGLGVMALVGVANAVPITFTHIGVGSGTIGSNSFTDAGFTITDTGDTAARGDCTDLTISPPGSCFFINDISASIAISGLGTFSIFTPTRTFVDQDLQTVGFSLAGIGGQDIFIGPDSPSFATYDLTTAIGPITGFGQLVQNQSLAGPLITSGGELLFQDGFVPQATFQAVLSSSIPEPSSFLLLALGLSGLAFFRRARG